MSQNQVRALLTRYAEDPLFFFRHELKIRTKGGGVSPLVLNPSQMYVHNKLEAQIKTQGRVRALLLKGRQQGMSTYTEARFFHKGLFLRGITTNIIAHSAVSSSGIFKMSKMFYDEMSKFCKPTLGASNGYILEFAKLRNVYQVLTAGTKDSGRGSTVQNFHGSEVAFWDNATAIMAGAMQAVAEMAGTEIILESTGQAGSWFHSFWDESEVGKTGYEAIFIPWTWQEEYSLDLIPEDFMLTEEEREIVTAHKLTPGQILWRRAKIATLGDELFRQEYPLTPGEAFSAVDGDPYIPAGVVWKAITNGRGVKLRPEVGRGEIVLGVDIARFGNDKTCFAWRQGRRVLDIERYFQMDTTEVAGTIRDAMRNPELPVDKVFLDASGVGGGVYDTLVNLMLTAEEAERVIPVDFGAGAIDKRRFDNRRNEMWFGMREWFLHTDLPAYLPDMIEIVQDVSGPVKKYKDSKLILESKEDMRRRGVKSPDIGDAIALTFAYSDGSGYDDQTTDARGSIYAQERQHAYTVRGGRGHTNFRSA
jgi:hypothetical protein